MKKAELWANSEWRAAHWGNRRGRPWADDDETCARFLRHCGMTDKDIGEILGRSKKSVEQKLGYAARFRRYAQSFEELRPAHAILLGRAADNFETVGTA